MISKNLHLCISAAAVVIVGLAYGCCPDQCLPLWMDITIQSTDSFHLLRATMGLYLGFAAYWMYGTIHAQQWRNATLTVVVFMSALACGRLTSIVLDGFPSLIFTIGLIVEIALALWGISNLKKEDKP